MTGTAPAQPEPAPPQAIAARLTARAARVLGDYRAALAKADLSEHTRRAYASRVAGFLGWLASDPDLGTDEDPLADPNARDYAVRDYRSWLTTDRHATPETLKSQLTALNHFHSHHLGLGAPVIKRDRIIPAGPKDLDEPDLRRFVRACVPCGSDAFNNADGTVLSEIHRRHRAMEFKKFLVTIDKASPTELDVPGV